MGSRTCSISLEPASKLRQEEQINSFPSLQSFSFTHDKSIRVQGWVCSTEMLFNAAGAAPRGGKKKGKKREAHCKPFLPSAAFPHRPSQFKTGWSRFTRAFPSEEHDPGDTTAQRLPGAALPTTPAQRPRGRA